MNIYTWHGLFLCDIYIMIMSQDKDKESDDIYISEKWRDLNWPILLLKKYGYVIRGEVKINNLTFY